MVTLTSVPKKETNEGAGNKTKNHVKSDIKYGLSGGKEFLGLQLIVTLLRHEGGDLKF